MLSLKKPKCLKEVSTQAVVDLIAENFLSIKHDGDASEWVLSLPTTTRIDLMQRLFQFSRNYMKSPRAEKDLSYVMSRSKNNNLTK